MNYDFLSLDKLRRFWFRYVGLTLAFCAITVGIYLKLTDASKLFGLTQDLLKTHFFALFIYHD